MRRGTLAAGTFLLLWATLTPAAQAPALAGTWILASGSSPSWGLGREFVATQDGKTLTISVSRVAPRRATSWTVLRALIP